MAWKTPILLSTRGTPPLTAASGCVLGPQGQGGGLQGPYFWLLVAFRKMCSMSLILLRKFLVFTFCSSWNWENISFSFLSASSTPAQWLSKRSWCSKSSAERNEGAEVLWTPSRPRISLSLT